MRSWFGGKFRFQLLDDESAPDNKIALPSSWVKLSSSILRRLLATRMQCPPIPAHPRHRWHLMCNHSRCRLPIRSLCHRSIALFFLFISARLDILVISSPLIFLYFSKSVTVSCVMQRSPEFPDGILMRVGRRSRQISASGRLSPHHRIFFFFFFNQSLASP